MSSIVVRVLNRAAQHLDSRYRNEDDVTNYSLPINARDV